MTDIHKIWQYAECVNKLKFFIPIFYVYIYAKLKKIIQLPLTI